MTGLAPRVRPCRKCGRAACVCVANMPACPRCVLDALSLLDAEDYSAARRLLIQSVNVHVHAYREVG